MRCLRKTNKEQRLLACLPVILCCQPEIFLKLKPAFFKQSKEFHSWAKQITLSIQHFQVRGTDQNLGHYWLHSG